MNFAVRKRRAPSIIIVSLVDILTILLIFFVVSTTFKKDQPEVQINLPESKTATSAPAELCSSAGALGRAWKLLGGGRSRRWSRGRRLVRRRVRHAFERVHDLELLLAGDDVVVDET